MAIDKKTKQWIIAIIIVMLFVLGIDLLLNYGIENT